MNNYDNLLYRLASYKDWPLNFPSAYSLANVGLFYSSNSDEVCCYKCHIYISNWKEGDIPVERHKLVSPNCPLVASYSLPVSETLSASSYGHSPNVAVQLPISNVQPERESVAESVTPTSPIQESIETNIPYTPISHQNVSVTSSNVHSSESHNLHMRSETVRLRTFVNWSCENVTPEELAKAGFFSMNVGDCVKCAFCNGVLKQWEPGDVPFEEHKKHSPKCQFVCGLNVGNIPITSHSSGLEERHKDSKQIPVRVQFSNNSDDKFSDINRRKLSFANQFHLIRNHDPDAFADAGFYYIGPFDRVKCFDCGGVLRNWSPEDDIWVEHAKWFPHCSFLLKRKGHTFVEAVSKSKEPMEIVVPNSLPVATKDQHPVRSKIAIVHPSDEGFDETTNLKLPFLSSNTSMPHPSSNKKVAGNTVSSHSAGASLSTNPAEHLKVRDEAFENVGKMDEKSSDVLLCKICMDEMANTVFLPCGHLLCCEHCAPVILECPVCRGIINGTLKVYIA